MTTSPTHQATKRLRNVAIIAHVDHGKTTLVDQLLKQSGMFRAGELEKLAGGQHDLIMDSNPLERERGITILSKNCAVQYVRESSSDQDPDIFHINIIDTPGHADFGGEVERVLRMADGCLLLVDSSEGAMPQTRFVLSKAIEAGLKPIVIVNKCDRPDARIEEVINEVFDLLVELGADDHALDFPIVYASGRSGWSTRSLEHAKTAKGQDHLPADPKANMRPIFEAIIEHVPAPKDDPTAPLQLLITTLDYNDYVGRIGIGRVFNGSIKPGQQVASVKMDGKVVSSKVAKLLKFQGLSRVDAQEVRAGDLCAVVGLESVDIGDTIANPENPIALPPVKIDEPTLTMVFRVNDSPFAGLEGTFVTSRQIRDRLMKELEKNVALRVDAAGAGDEFVVSGRGLLHLGVLLETMRREGFELSVGKPQVVIKTIDNIQHEPIEWLVIDVPTDTVGPVMELVGTRKGELKTMEPRGATGETTHLEFEIPARGLIGLRSRLLTASQGQAIMHHTFERFAPMTAGSTAGRTQGVLVANETGAVTTYACELMAERGILFVSPGEKVYEGMVVGEHNRDNDLVVNITRLKHLTNIRAASKEATVVLKQPRKMSLEQCLEYIEDDELVEITPTTVRMRKRVLQESLRKRVERQTKDREAAKVE